jgi:hypothetical protein
MVEKFNGKLKAKDNAITAHPDAKVILRKSVMGLE